MTQQYILIITIGPVQGFIAEARRTADLFTGSHILVELARAMVKAIVDHGGELIYPASENLTQSNAKEKPDIPNKMVAIVSEPAIVAKTAHQAMLEKWAAFAQHAFKKLKLGITLTVTKDLKIDVAAPDEVLQKIITRQLNHHMEFYWAAAEYDGTANGYKTAYELADRALGARKQTRNFAQVVEDGFKDSLGGMRAALWCGWDKDARQFWDRFQKLPQFSRQLQEGELLDTLGFIKRFGSDKKFPSTSTVAASSFARKCNLQNIAQLISKCNNSLNPKSIQFEDETIQAAIDEVEAAQKNEGYFYPVETWPNFKYDGDLLYTETYTVQNLASRYHFTAENYRKVEPQLQQIIKTLQELYKTTQSLPSPYYAILQMDGDSMGEHISQCKTQEDHQKVSKFLDCFTHSVAGLVQQHHGYLIYAGGDDVLAFFPADCALNAAEQLRIKYCQLFKDWNHGHDKPFTASIGIAFAHYLDPLDLVLRMAREAEKRAKNVHGRNAIAVTILRRSGETLEVGGKWAGEVDKAAPNTVDLVIKLVKDLEYKISSRFPYAVLNESKVVTKLGHDGRQAMLKLLLGRHTDKKVGFDSKLEDWLAWANAHDAWTPPDPDSLKADNSGCPPDNKEGVKNQGYVELARWFVVARWLSAGGQE